MIDRSEAEREDFEAEPGWRLYLLLAVFDTHDGSMLAALVQAAREGYEHDGIERGAWEEFDRMWLSMTPGERLALGS